MSESGEKTEQASEKKIRDARRQGQLPQRKNILEAILLVQVILSLLVFSEMILVEVQAIAVLAVKGTGQTFGDVIGAMAAPARKLTFLVSGILVVTFFTTLLFGLLLNKFNFSIASIAPKFEKFNPVSGLKNIFSKNTFYNFLRLTLLFLLISAASLFLITRNFRDVLEASFCGLACSSDLFLILLFKLVLSFLFLHVVFAALDYKIQNLVFLSQHKMTKDEVKREHKQAEGDPMLRSVRKSIANEDSQLPTIDEATHVVFGNMVLVAIIYYHGHNMLPFMVYKSKGANVANIRSLAKKKGILTVNNPSVASEFYKIGSVGKFMPAKSAKGMHIILQSV
ncbi:EscU/YscU/HrcU family type III secretion system export apparatus switch protein [Ruegeria sp. SCPT10]|uniref:EscU/YscU/HrcU family type III secretion system export apparatus switch protein n=1 Tax=Ruegeria sp. SCP10 TaxID=3141377 RepID=UPI003336EB90